MATKMMTNERFASLVEKSMKLRDAGITAADIEARRVEVNKIAEANGFMSQDFNDVLELVYREKFVPVPESV